MGSSGLPFGVVKTRPRRFSPFRLSGILPLTFLVVLAGA